MKRESKTRASALALALCAACAAWGEAPADYGQVELIRDAWGTPHVFSSTIESLKSGRSWMGIETRPSCF